MRVLFVTAVFENEATGAARFARLVHKYGKDSFTILTEDSEGGEGIILLDISPKWYQRKLWQYFRIKTYRDRIKSMESDYDVFLFNNTLLADGFHTSKPVYVCIHDDKLVYPKPAFKFDYVRRLILGKIERRVLESGKFIIANSKFISKKFSEHFDIKDEDLLTMYQGIELNDDADFQDTLDDQVVIKVLFVKNDYRRGGLIDLYNALMLLNDYQFELHIVGPSDLDSQNFSHAENIESNIHGPISNERVLKLMQDCNLFCLPTKAEPLGVSVMEALAMGLPTVTTGVGGLPEVTDNGNLVWECAPGNKKSIATQIAACINNRQKRLEKSKAREQSITDNFAFEKVFHRLNDIVNSKRK